MDFNVFEIGPLDALFFVFLFYVIYKLFLKRDNSVKPLVVVIPPLEKQDLTVEQLRKYNGIDDPHICIAILGKVSFTFYILQGNIFSIR